METVIQKLKDTITYFEFHFDRYRECRHQSKHASKKPDRERNLKSMISI